jgi:hypothetical protein
MNSKLSLIFLFFASLITTNAYAALSTGTCDGQRLSYAADNNIVDTNSQAFLNVPGMLRTITIPGRTSTCVVIDFSLEAYLPLYENSVTLRATRDGVQCLPNVQLSLDPGENIDFNIYKTYSTSFICPGVTPGTHNFRIQWSSFENDSASMRTRTMILHHR